MSRAVAAALAVATVVMTAMAAAAPATRADDAASPAAGLRLAGTRSIPIEYFQGVTHDPAGTRFFAGIAVALYRTDPALRRRAQVDDAIPPAARSTYAFDHIGDPTWDASHGGRLVLPLECFTPGAPNGGNTCGQGGLGVAGPATLATHYVVALDPRDIAKAMWAEASPDGRLVWTSAGPDLIAYRTADITAANAAVGVRIRPVRRLRGAVPPSGVTGAAFLRGRLLLAGQDTGPLEIWSVDVRTGARRREVALNIVGESEGLDAVDDRRGLVQLIFTPFPTGGRPPTYGVGHNELLSFVPIQGSRRDGA